MVLVAGRGIIRRGDSPCCRNRTSHGRCLKPWAWGYLLVGNEGGLVSAAAQMWASQIRYMSRNAANKGSGTCVIPWLVVAWSVIDSPLSGLQNPIDIMFHLQPLMFLGLFPLFAVFEGA